MAKKKKNVTVVDTSQSELHNLIEMKKMRQAAMNHQGDMPVIPKEEPILPKTFKEKWTNYWYHYKALTWGTVFLAILGVWFVKDVFFGPKFDISLNIATKYKLTAINPKLENDVLAYIQDYDEDGKVTVNLAEMQLILGKPQTNEEAMKEEQKLEQSEGDPAMQLASQQKLMAILASGDDLLFFLDDEVYKYIQGDSPESIFIDFSALYPELEAVEGDRINLTKTKLGKKMKLDRLKRGDVYLVVRKMLGTVKDNEKNQEKTEQALDFAYQVLAETYPDLQKAE